VNFKYGKEGVNMKSFTTNDEDITDEEFERYYAPFEKVFREYLNKYIVPEVVAFQIANYYYRGILVNSSLLIHYNSMVNVFSMTPKYDDVKDEIINLLRIKYSLNVEKEDPLILSKNE